MEVELEQALVEEASEEVEQALEVVVVREELGLVEVGQALGVEEQEEVLEVEALEEVLVEATEASGEHQDQTQVSFILVNQLDQTCACGPSLIGSFHDPEPDPKTDPHNPEMIDQGTTHLRIHATRPSFTPRPRNSARN